MSDNKYDCKYCEYWDGEKCTLPLDQRLAMEDYWVNCFLPRGGKVLLEKGIMEQDARGRVYMNEKFLEYLKRATAKHLRPLEREEDHFHEAVIAFLSKEKSYTFVRGDELIEITAALKRVWAWMRRR